MVEMCQNLGRVGLGWEGCGNLAGQRSGEKQLHQAFHRTQKNSRHSDNGPLAGYGPGSMVQKAFPRIYARQIQPSQSPSRKPST